MTKKIIAQSSAFVYTHLRLLPVQAELEGFRSSTISRIPVQNIQVINSLKDPKSAIKPVTGKHHQKLQINKKM
jgi:hypothetical protein